MIEFKTDIRQVPTIEDLLNILYPAMQPLADPEGAYAEEGMPLIVCPEENDNDYFEEGREFSFYIPFMSTRPVLVWREEQSLKVRARTLLSPIDFALALQIVKAMRKFGAVSVVTDDEPDVPIGFDFLDNRFSPTWYMNWARSGMRDMMVTLNHDPDTLFVMSGPFADFSFGSLMNSVFEDITDEEDRLHILHEMMRRMNYWTMDPETKDIQIAATSESEKGTTIAYVELDTTVVVQKADSYCFFKGDDSLLLIDRDEFFCRCEPGEKFELMDEFQVQLHITEDDLGSLMNGELLELSTS